VWNRPAIDPEIYLPDVGTGELLRIASVPPPAQVPAGPPPSYRGLLSPIWLTYQHPFSGEDDTQRVDSFDLAGDERWYLAAQGAVVSVTPLCDGPDGKAIVVRVYRDDVTLVHLHQGYRTMVVTEYEGLDIVNVAVGDMVDLGTVLGTGDRVYAFQYRKVAASPLAWASGEPFTWPHVQGLGGQLANREYWADPACCLPEPATFEATGGSPTWDHLRDCASEPGWA